MCKEDKKHLLLDEEMLFLMRCIRDEIWHRRTPTDVIFSRLSSPLLEKSGFYDELKKTNELYKAAEPCALSSQVLLLTREFSEKIGKTDAESQRTEFDYIIAKTEEHIKKMRAELPKKQKLNVTIPAFFGILFVIVFM